MRLKAKGLNSFKGGYIGYWIGYSSRAIKGDARSFVYPVWLM